MSAERFGDEGVLEQLPASLRRLMTFERSHLHRVGELQRTSRDPTFETKYFPQNCGAFMLPCFWVRRSDLYVYGRPTLGMDELSFFEGCGLNERVLLPIHPSALDHCKEFLSSVKAHDAAKDGLRIWAVPTSSTRTLLAWPDGEPEKAIFVKTSLHSPIFGDRRICPKSVGRSVGLSNIVQDSLGELPISVAYLPESVGFVPRRLQDSGTIVRSIPNEIKAGKILVAPLFSLFGGTADHAPLFLTIVRQNGMDPMTFLEEVLCAPFARSWLELSMRFGLMLEAHGQDLMLVLSPKLTPLGRFFYRDFEGLQVDWDLRRSRGSPAPKDMPHAWSWHETYATWGFRYGEFAWYKWQISLFDYLHFVINQLELSLIDWHRRGLIGGRVIEEDTCTMIFSEHLLDATEQMFGVTLGAKYNIYRSLNKYILLLLKLRKNLITPK